MMLDGIYTIAGLETFLCSKGLYDFEIKIIQEGYAPVVKISLNHFWFRIKKLERDLKLYGVIGTEWSVQKLSFWNWLTGL